MIEITSNKLKSYRFIDLFAGLGGFRLALESFGAECVYSSEWDKAAQEVYRKNFGEIPDGDITKVDEDRLYKMFGVDAELLIDHAWGIETTRMEDIKAYRPKKNSFSSGQVLMRDYERNECRIVVKEMADALCLDLVDKGCFAGSVSLYLGYSSSVF